jgi:2-dehydro-3-deoxyphosphogluconate aldolase/(4S)-4-hydroxy-2-oxoglutarate aldolase
MASADEGAAVTQTSDTQAEVLATRLVPVIVIDDAAAAVPLADALVAGGLRSAEVTFRTDAAEAVVRAMSADGRLLVGAGTVVTADQVDRAVAAGARFIVSPGFSPAVVRRGRDVGVPVFPGVATATEIIAALAEGVDVVKFFPAEPLGGVTMIKALAAPFRSVRFIPTGGIAAAQLPAYLAVPAVAAVGGSWMVAPKLISEGRWDEITKLTAEAVAVAAASTKE